MTDREIEKLKGESLVELRVKARNLGIKSVTTYNKSGLIEKIKEAIQGGHIKYGKYPLYKAEGA